MALSRRKCQYFFFLQNLQNLIDFSDNKFFYFNSNSFIPIPRDNIGGPFEAISLSAFQNIKSSQYHWINKRESIYSQVFISHLSFYAKKKTCNRKIIQNNDFSFSICDVQVISMLTTWRKKTIWWDCYVVYLVFTFRFCIILEQPFQHFSITSHPIHISKQIWTNSENKKDIFPYLHFTLLLAIHTRLTIYLSITVWVYCIFHFILFCFFWV